MLFRCAEEHLGRASVRPLETKNPNKDLCPRSSSYSFEVACYPAPAIRSNPSGSGKRARRRQLTFDNDVQSRSFEVDDPDATVFQISREPTVSMGPAIFRSAIYISLTSSMARFRAIVLLREVEPQSARLPDIFHWCEDEVTCFYLSEIEFVEHGGNDVYIERQWLPFGSVMESLTRPEAIKKANSYVGDVEHHGDLLEHELQCMHSPSEIAASEVGDYVKDDLNADSYPALSALEAKVGIFDVVPSWLMDAGCPQDLISEKYSRDFLELVRPAKSIPFRTAGGTRVADTVLELGGQPIACGHVDAYIMQSTPAVLSIGKRVCDFGYSFVWIHGKLPCLITPERRVVPLDVKMNCPYIMKGGAHETTTEREDVAESTGINIRRGKVCFTSSAFDGCPALPATEGGASSSTDVLPSAQGPHHDSIIVSDVGSGGVRAVETADAEAKTPKEEPRTDDETDVPDTSDASVVSTDDDRDSDDDGAVLMRGSLIESKCTLRHRLTHRPCNSSKCEACMVGKTRQKPFRRKKSTREITKFGDVVSCYHNVFRSLE